LKGAVTVAIFAGNEGKQISDPEKLIEEFRQKLISSLQQEKAALIQTANQEAQSVLTKAYQESAATADKARAESRDIAAKTREQTNREAENILAQARRKAEQIIKEAEEATRKEARDKTRREVENILRTTREEAVKQSARTLQSAKEESNNIIASAKKEAAATARKFIEDAEKEATDITRSAREIKSKAAEELGQVQRKTAEAVEAAMASAHQSAREQAAKEAEEIVSQAVGKAQKEREQLLSKALNDAKNTAETEKTQILSEARREADQIVKAAQEKVRVRIEESSRLMLELQQKMTQVINSGFPINSIEERPPETSLSTARTVSPIETEVHGNHTDQALSQVGGETGFSENEAPDKPEALLYNEENRTYHGRLKIDVAPPADKEQIYQLEKQLHTNTDIKIISQGTGQDGSAWIELDIHKPVQILDVLRNNPSVKDVVGARSYIIVALRSKQLV
jgi:vacuolar-type H+-ATPase subunit H